MRLAFYKDIHNFYFKPQKTRWKFWKVIGLISYKPILNDRGKRAKIDEIALIFDALQLIMSLRTD